MTHFIPFDVQKNINYTFLFSLYRIATKSKDKIKSIVIYNTVECLRESVNAQTQSNLSRATISRYLKDNTYNTFFTCDKQHKKIILHNNFKKDNTDRINKFITLTDKELTFLINQDDNLLTRYYIYIKYYCGHTKDKTTDFTAKQFLSYIGYSGKSGNTLTKICNYNSLLVENKFITIKKKRDNNGNIRNIYNMNI